MKRIISLLLCVLVLASCGAGKPGASSNSANAAAPGSVPMGRWTESAVRLDDPEAVIFGAPVRQADGTLAMLAASGTPGEDGYSYPALKKWISEDGDVWREEPLDWPQGRYLPRGAVSENGDLLFFLTEGENLEDGLSLWYWKAGGTPRPASFQDPQLSGRSFRQFGFWDRNTLYGVRMAQLAQGEGVMENTLLLIDLETGETRLEKELEDSGMLPAAAVYDDAVYYLPYAQGGRTLESIDAKGNPSQDQRQISNEMGADAATFDAEGNYYFASSTGVHRFAKGGNILETIFEGGAFAFVPEGKMIAGLCRTADGDFVLLVMDTNTDTFALYRYHFDETLPAVNEQQVNVWSLQENATVRAALVEFSQQHPEITINYTPVAANDTVLSREDLLRTLNTELLAGRGPDVLIFDDVDYQSYIDKGMLADLAETVDLSALKPELTGPFVQDGKAYVLPARFSVPILFGDPGSVEDLTTLEALQKAVLACAPRPDVNVADAGYYDKIGAGEQYALSLLSVEQLVRFVLRSSAPALKTGKELNEDALRAVLSFIQEVGGYYGLADYRAEQPSNSIVASGSGDTSDAVVLGDGTNEYSSTGHARYGWETLDTPAVLGMLYRADYEKGQRFPVSVIVQPGLAEGAFLPKTLVGVNAASPQKDAALAFVEALFSPAIQDGYYLDGTAVRTDSFQKFLERNESAVARGELTGGAQALYDGLKTPVVIDPTVEAKLAAHAERLCAGNETLDEAVAGVQSDLALYLAEQN